MKANFSQILPYFSLNIPLRSSYCKFNCPNMLLWSAVLQITQIQLSTNTHFWVINWNPHIEIFPGRPPCMYTIWPIEVKSYSSPTATTFFSDSRDTCLTKNHYENYSLKMVPTNPTGSWPICKLCVKNIFHADDVNDDVTAWQQSQASILMFKWNCHIFRDKSRSL